MATSIYAGWIENIVFFKHAFLKTYLGSVALAQDFV